MQLPPINPPMRIAFVGSRAWEDADMIAKRLLRYDPTKHIIVTTDAPWGADALIGELAVAAGFAVDVRPVTGNVLRDSTRLIARCQRAELFWDCESHGTFAMLTAAVYLECPFHLELDQSPDAPAAR